MTNLFRTFSATLGGVALLAASTAASAAAESRTATPVMTRAQVSVVDGVRSVVTPSSVIVVVPRPLPATPANACARGNSSGVSRC